MKNNIILIGMPGCGKSTIGVVLAKFLCMDFIDADLVIQRSTGKPLQTLLNEHGMKQFLEIEADVIESLSCCHGVIATGGSAVLTARASEHLMDMGIVVYISLPYMEIEKRISNLSTRGIAMVNGETLFDVYKKRIPYYERCADIVVNTSGKTIEESCRTIIAAVERFGNKI